jgi:hypothetical protein
MKRRVIDRFLPATLAFCLVGCSTHPLPQDVSHVSTAQIVGKIRCEAKEGIEAAVQNAILKRTSAHVERIIKVSTVGFEFDFQMFEDNKASADTLTFERPSAKPGESFTLELAGSNINGDLGKSDSDKDRTRGNVRIFRILDHLQDLRNANCSPRKATEANLIYPITGSTGMAEVLQTYIELETITDLPKPGSSTVTKETDVFSDELAFTTRFEAGGTLLLSFETKVGTLRLSKASLAASALRKDVHKVTVALAREDDPDVFLRSAAQRSAGKIPTFAPTRELRVLPVEQVRDKRVRERLVQRAAAPRNRVLLELERRRLVKEDGDVVARVLGQPVP